MCGIAGILRIHPPGTPPPPPEVAIAEAWLDILDDAIMHRGPDGQGRFRDRAVRADGTVVDVALVHRRLAIIDLAGGHQPMVSQRGRNEGEGLVAVVFNGCIYNHRELRKELQAAGHRFETDHSDTEVLVHGWREWQAGLLPRLEGMFALAVWDRGRGSLTIARDRFGEKPMCWGRQRFGPSAATAFASVPNGLLRLWQRWRRADQSTVFHHSLRTWITMGYSPFGGLPLLGTDELPAGKYVEPTCDGARGALDYPSAGARDAVPERPQRELSPDRLDALVSGAVRGRLEADVPLGVFLSGGVDSSLIAVKAFQCTGRLSTFCVRMPDDRYDESRFAAAAARAIGTEHTTLDCEPHPAEDLARLIEQLGLPFGDSSLLPTYWVSKAAASHVRVALGGEGGDEFFGGYERHQAAPLLRRYRGALRHIPLWMLSETNPRSRRAKLARLCRAARGDGYLDLVRLWPGSEARSLLANEPEGVPPYIADLFIERPTVGAIVWDQVFYLPGDLLRKSDTASMAVPLELRAPLLDSRLTGAALAAPLETLMPSGQRKGLLRQVARRYLPAEIVDRPKQGFAIPIGEWFRSDYGGMRQLLMDHLNSAEPWGPSSLGIELNMKFVRQMLDEHLGTGPSGRVVRDHSQRLYMLLVLSIWAKWLGGLR